MAASGSHIFYDYFLQDGGRDGPLAPPGSATLAQIHFTSEIRKLCNIFSLFNSNELVAQYVEHPEGTALTSD